MLGLQHWPGIETLLDKCILFNKCKGFLNGAVMSSRQLRRALIERGESIQAMNEQSPDIYIIETTLIHIVDL